MCGIVGIVEERRSAGDSGSRVERMVRAIRHRGPDATGVWREGGTQLGHARLSIIDLSDAGTQPMLDDTGQYVLVYNGEVYNYRELRDQLRDKGYKFRTLTDTEVVLQAFRAWGPSCVTRFNGMWSFAIWDREERQLFAARDRAGKKPFYYAVDTAGGIYFGSEVKALMAAGLRFGVNPQAAFDFLTQGTYGHLGQEGFFSGLLQLPAAHYLTVRPGGRPVVTRYWDLPSVREGDRLPYDEGLQRRFRELLIDSVRLRLRSDVTVGATLSGGLDSSTLVGIIDHLTGGAPLHLFTAQFRGTRYDESAYVDAVVARLGNPILHSAAGSASSIREDLSCALDHQEEPFGDTSILAHLRLMRTARSMGVPVILSGQGSDELLMGYPSMVRAYLGHLMSHGQLRRALTEARQWGEGMGVAVTAIVRGALPHTLPLRLRDLVRSALYVRSRARVASSRLRQAATYLRFEVNDDRNALESYLAQVFVRFSIPHLVHYDDRNAMAFGVEGRMPFLDHRVVELLFSVRYEAMFNGGFTKRLLRDTFADVLPDSVRWRRDKIGFYTPLSSWLRSEAAWVREVLCRDRVAEAGLISWVDCNSAMNRLQAGDDSAATDVWRSFILHLWLARFRLTGL